MKTTAKDLRFHAKELLDTATRGEEVIITYRGKPCAKLVAYDEISEKRSECELFGIWKDYRANEDVEGFVRSLRKERTFK